MPGGLPFIYRYECKTPNSAEILTIYAEFYIFMVTISHIIKQKAIHNWDRNGVGKYGNK